MDRADAWRMRSLTALSILVPLAGIVPPAEARSRADLAVYGQLQAHDSSISSMALRHREAVTDGLDLVVAVGGHGGWRLGQPVPRGPARLGLFLQDRARPDLVHTLAIEPCPCSPEPVIERVTATDAVFACKYEKHQRMPNEKFVYDVRAKAMVGRVSYQPFAMSRIFETPGGAVLVGTDSRRLVAVAFTPGMANPLRILPDDEAARWIRRVRVEESEGSKRIPDDWIGDYPFGPDRRFTLARLREGGTVIREEGERAVVRLPESSLAEFKRARPEQFENIGPDVRIEETIGPHEREGDVLWFGKEFYEGEGWSGVGGFGTFDPATKSFSIQAPPEIAEWSVSALDVAPDAAWMALVQLGELDDWSGGLLRVDRATGAARRYELRDLATAILRVGDVTLGATEMGIAIVTSSGEIRRFLVDVTTDGHLRIAEALGVDPDTPIR